MRRMLLALAVTLLCLAECFGPGARPARADGAIFPVDANTGYPAVRYHHVTVDIDGPLAVTHVEQEFYNPYDYTVESRYLFPVPPGASLTRFQATLDGQPQAPVRQDAAATNAALRTMIAGRREPRLLQFADWETLAFNVSLPPRAARRMTLQYEQVLLPAGGLYGYHYVLSTESYSAEPLREVALTVNLRAPGGLATVYSAAHPATIERAGAEAAVVRWQAADVLPGEDFQLFFAPAQAGFGGGLLAGRRAGRDHFLFFFTPQAGLAPEDYLPKDIVFVLDRSGSMLGAKLDQARDALRYLLGRLGPDDRFALVSFNHGVSAPSGTLQSPGDAALAAARRYVDGLQAEGSTNLAAALRAGLAILTASPPRQQGARGEHQDGATQLMVFLTDGLPTAGLTDEDLIAAEVQAANAELGARLHVFGVGYDVNTHLLDRLAADNGGSVNYVQPGEDLERSLTAFYDRVARPVLTGVKVSFDGMDVQDVYPREAPDLFAGGSLLLAGQYRATSPTATVRVQGRTAQRTEIYTYTFDLEQVGDHDFVPRLWATRRVGALLDRVRVAGEDRATVDEIRDLGLSYGLITPYTDFVIAAQTQGAASAANMQLYRDQGALNQMSGRVTVQARVQNQAYQQAEQANLATGANILNRRQYSLAQVGNLNVDLALLPRGAPAGVSLAWLQQNVGISRTIDFGSDAYFRLAADPEARPALETGTNVVFSYQGQVVQVQDGAAQAGTAAAPRVRVNGRFDITFGEAIVRWAAQLWPVVREMLGQARPEH